MKHSVLLFAAFVCCTIGFAKEPQRPQTYNYQRGVELIQTDQLDEGVEYMRKELQQNPQNGYAFVWIASVYAQKHERGTAIHTADLALKYIPKNDKYYIAWTHCLKGRMYLELSDTVTALACFTAAIKTEPKNEEWYEYRGCLYQEMKEWNKSDADFRQYIQLTPGLTRGNMYLGRNLFLQEKYEEALEQYQYAHKFAERAFTFSAMAEAEVKLGKYEDAANHIVESLKLEFGEYTCIDIIDNCKEEELVELLKNKFRALSLAYPNVLDWHLYMMYVQRAQKEYEEAIRTCRKIQAIDANAFFDDYMASLYCNMGDWESALAFHTKAIESDTTNIDYRYARAYTYDAMDSLAQMYADMDYLIKQNPDNAQLYFARAGMYFFHQQYEKAIDDYDSGLAFEQNDWERYMRGRCYAAVGRTDKAEKEYKYLETHTTQPEVLMFVKALLGKKDEVLVLADSLLKADTTHRYNIACAYALVNERELAFVELTKTLQEGYVYFFHLRLDPDLQSLHGTEFDLLIQQYETLAAERIAKFKAIQGRQQSNECVVEIPFTATNGVTKVDCTINGLPLNFVFDTGASDVTISQTEANFMFKNGYLSPRDVVGKQFYQTADGNISVGTTFVINHINFGGLELTGVRASVVENQKAPLLLGQTILKRLGKIEIDNERRVLKITTNVSYLSNEQ
ncbi:MAG: retroviral-like aspartic protease family protein [Paludibacteraceae bacterium]